MCALSRPPPPPSPYGLHPDPSYLKVLCPDPRSPVLCLRLPSATYAQIHPSDRRPLPLPMSLPRPTPPPPSTSTLRSSVSSSRNPTSEPRCELPVPELRSYTMGHGVSNGGGQSSLGYLFGSGEAPTPATTADNASPVQKRAPSPPVDKSKQIPTGIQGNTANNYFRADGQNSGNFITVFEGTFGIDNKYTTVQFTGEINRLWGSIGNVQRLSMILGGNCLVHVGSRHPQ